MAALVKGRLGAVGEKLTHRAPGPGFEAASLHICGGKACFGYPFPRTPLKWEPPGTGSALLIIQCISARILRGLRIAARLGFQFSSETSNAIHDLSSSIINIDKVYFLSSP